MMMNINYHLLKDSTNVVALLSFSLSCSSFLFFLSACISFSYVHFTCLPFVHTLLLLSIFLNVSLSFCSYPISSIVPFLLFFMSVFLRQVFSSFLYVSLSISIYFSLDHLLTLFSITVHTSLFSLLSYRPLFSSISILLHFLSSFSLLVHLLELKK